MKALKQICNVFLIIGFVLGIVLAVSMVISSVVFALISAGVGSWAKDMFTDSDLSGEAAIAFCITMSVMFAHIAPLFIGTTIVSKIGREKLQTAKKRDDLLPIAIMNAIFGINVSGALLIVISCLLPANDEPIEVEVVDKK